MKKEGSQRRSSVRILSGVAAAACCAAWSLAQGAASPGALTRTETAYPTGDRATSILLIERFSPAEVRAGESCSYELRLTNLTRVELQGLNLVEQTPAGMQVSLIQPEPDRRSGNEAAWDIDTLGPGRTFSVRVGGTAGGTEDLLGCARVTFQANICSSTRIVEPALALQKTAPEEVLICDPIPLQFVVTNTGTGVARAVRVTDRLPEGWTTAEGRKELTFDAGDLAAGQSRSFSATVKAARTGRFVNTAQATEAGGLTAEAEARTRVTQPVLKVSKTGPAFRYIGRPAKFEITVRNDGDAPARDTVLVDTLPADVELKEVSDDGTVSGRTVTWNLGTLAPGQSRSVSLTVVTRNAGRVVNTAVARAYCTEAEASAPLEVKGIPAILLEVIDVHDPIEVGHEETYEIRVLNQGSAVGTNIAITCTLPPEEEYLRASGPTNAQVSGRTVTFAPLPSLAPKAETTFRVVVKGLKTGDVRFKVTMTSDQTSSPVEETESTHIY